MKKLGLLVRLKAKAGKEKNVEEFITSALPLANEEAGTIESTSMGATSKSFFASQKTGSVSLECYWDSTDAGQDDLDVRSKVEFEIYPNGVGTGKRYTGVGIVTNKSISVSFDGMVEASFEIQANGDITESAAP